MEVVNRVVPNAEQVRGFMEPGQDGPIYMLNLLKFKAKAEYDDGRETDLAGAEAYAIYGAEVVGHLARVGAAPMLDMLSSPDYQASVVHRAAGLAGQLNIELVQPVGAWLMQQQD